MKMDCGCNAHIVRLPQNQQFTNFDPPGCRFRNCLIFNETNNVCVAPTFLACCYHKNPIAQIRKKSSSYLIVHSLKSGPT